MITLGMRLEEAEFLEDLLIDKANKEAVKKFGDYGYQFLLIKLRSAIAKEKAKTQYDFI